MQVAGRVSPTNRLRGFETTLYVQVASRAGPADRLGGFNRLRPILIEKAPSVWRRLWKRLFLYKSTDFSVTDGIDSKHEQESRQPPADARPTGRH